MELNSYFTDFLGKIRPTEAQTKELKDAHTPPERKTAGGRRPRPHDRQPVSAGELPEGNFHPSSGG